jgi:tetratricopeptide (TPR) repeat protein
MKQFMLVSGLALSLSFGARGAANEPMRSAVGFPVNGAPAGGTYAAWQGYRDAVLKDDSIVRFYSFADLTNAATPVPNLAGKDGALKSEGGFEVVDGRFPEKKAVRLDRGGFTSEPFALTNKTFTLEAWIKLNGPGALTGNPGVIGGTLFSMGIGYWSGWRVTMRYPDRRLEFHFGCPAPTNAVTVGTEPVSDRAWHHLAATWDGQRMRVYLDGLLAGAGPYTRDFYPSGPDAKFRIGTAAAGWGSVVLDVDEVAVYAHALSALEVLRHARFYAPLSEPLAARFAAAETAFEKQDFAAASTEYANILKQVGVPSPYPAIARLRLAETARAQKQLPAAFAECRKVWEAPDVSEGLRAVAKALLFRLVREGAGEVPPDTYETILKSERLSSRDRTDFHLALMQSYRQRKDWAAAHEQFGKALKSGGLSPTEFCELTLACLRRAQTAVQAKDYGLARAECEAVLAIPGAPEHLKAEARERMREGERMEKGLPPRDPAASRTVVPAMTNFAAEVFVAPDGNDKHAGTRAAPVAGLTRARDLVRQIRARGERGAVAVNVQPGEYPVAGTIELAAADSGTAKGPVVYRAVQPGKAVFYGGRRLTGFQSVTNPAIRAQLPEEARSKVQCCDLRALGITEYGRLAVRGFGASAPPPTVELFVNGKSMPLARWPNTGFVDIRKVVSSGDKQAGKPTVFEYADNRHARWTQAKDAWLFGYFRYLWADGTLAVSRVDPQARTLICDEPYPVNLNDPPGPGATMGRYYAFNLLEEIDQPGEWYLDREVGMLYLWQPVELAGAVVDLGTLAAPMVTMDQVFDVRLEGLTFVLGRYNGLVLSNCTRVLIAGCAVSRFAGNGITISGGEANGMLGCDIHTIGRTATEVIGGNRETLTPGRHFVENCRIYDFGRIDRTYTPAIQLEGVGNRAAHNQMSDCPSSVMRIEGNDHLVEYNDIRDAVRESDDQGGIDMWGNPTYRGVVIRFNRFTKVGSWGGIRFDDAISGMVVYGNVFIRCGGAVQMNGGRDNIIDNNLIVECGRGFTGGWNGGNAIWQTLSRNGDLTPYGGRAAFITNALYLSRYPAMATMLTPPGVNHAWRNVFRGSPAPTPSATFDVIANAAYGDPGFVDAAKGDWCLKPDAAPYADLGFRPIPFEEIGLYQDAYRLGLPGAE